MERWREHDLIYEHIDLINKILLPSPVGDTFRELFTERNLAI